jgi:hypothetical protein
LFHVNFFSDSQDQFSPEDSNGGNSTLNSTAESTIAIVQLEAIDAFCKLMLDTNLGWAKSGQQAGLPPTIIATESFLNAALKSLNVSKSYLQCNNFMILVQDSSVEETRRHAVHVGCG